MTPACSALRSFFRVRAARLKGKVERRRRRAKVEGVKLAEAELEAEQKNRRSIRLPRKEEYRVIACPRKGKEETSAKLQTARVIQQNGGFSLTASSDSFVAQAKIRRRLHKVFFKLDEAEPKYRNFTNINGTRKKEQKAKEQATVNSILAQLNIKDRTKSSI